MMIKAIIFDLDGTLIDSMGLWRQVDEDFLSSRGITVPPDLFEHLPQGNSFIQTAQYFKDRFSLSESVEQIMQIWTQMVSKNYESSVALKSGASELLQILQDKGLRIGLGTSNSYELAEKSLSFNKVWHYFENVVSGDMHLLGKPYPDIYLKCAEGLGIMPQQCLVVEDTLAGVQAARNAGMQVIAIYDSDSRDQHQQIRELADSFVMDYLELHHELKQRVNL
ncbi:MAG: HAD family phosphatase [Candidatus Cloacimonetes bacterium]|nr:HAD family phosphatase [Candidatus Cloacimonadota bacterium]MDD4033936.1 HAD family phosphatase [Candidatus Cloacimonadota bacterium]